MAHLPDQEHGPGCIGGEVQLLCPDIDITGQDIIHDDVLDEGAPVMLLLVEGLGIVQGDVGQLAEAPGGLIVAGAEHRILEVVGIADDRLEGLLAEGDDALGCVAHLQGSVGPALAQQGHVGTGNHGTLGVNNAESTVGDLLQLNDNTLKNTVGHFPGLPYNDAQMHNSRNNTIIIYCFCAFCKYLLTFYCKT